MAHQPTRSSSSKVMELRGLPGMGEYELSRVRTAELYFVPALVESLGDLSRLTALEIGCGKGPKSAVFGELFKKYVGVDLNQKEIDIARSNLMKIGGRAECHFANGIEVARDPTRFGFEKKPDVLIMFAVLEHLLPEERVELIGLMKEVVDGGGAVLFAETPNRLVAHDAHSSQLHFAQSLPVDLMLRYVQNSKHQQWLRSLHEWGNDTTALHRVGLGLSYHDFELDFADDTRRMPLAFSGWSHHMMSNQPVQNDEVALLQYFSDNNLPVHAGFARYWLDGLLFKNAKRFHVWTQVFDFREWEAGSRQAWNYPETSLLSDRPIVIKADKEADDIELSIQFNVNSSDGTLFVDGVAVADLASNFDSASGSWHNVGTITVKIGNSPTEIRVKKGNAALRALVANGYSIVQSDAPKLA